MFRATYIFNEEIAALRAKEWKLGEKPSDDMFVRAGATDIITIDNGTIREEIKGDEGYFKDITCKLSDISRTSKGKDFFFLQGENHTFCIKLDTITEGSIEDVLAMIKTASNSAAGKERAESKDRAQFGKLSKEARDFFRKAKPSGGKVPLKVKFRPNIVLMTAGVIFAILGIADSMFVLHYMPTLFSMIVSLGLSAIGGFWAGYMYTFFVTWFNSQKEAVRVGSLIMFPITITIFFLVTLFGFIPYTIYVIFMQK